MDSTTTNTTTNTAMDTTTYGSRLTGLYSSGYSRLLDCFLSL